MARPLAGLAALALLAAPSMVGAPGAPADALAELRTAMLADPEAKVVVRDAAGAREVAAGVAAGWLRGLPGVPAKDSMLAAGAGDRCSSIHLIVIAAGYGSNIQKAVPAPVPVGSPTVCGRPAETYLELRLLGFGCATAMVWVVPPAAPGATVCAPYRDWSLMGHASSWELLGFGYSYSHVDAEYGTVESHAD